MTATPTIPSLVLRDRDEIEGRYRRTLGEQCAAAGLDMVIAQESIVGRCSYRAAVINQRTGSRITEHNRDLVEGLDRVLDRLNREEWDL